MSSRRPVRQLLVAVLLGVLVGGGLMAVAPAGAEISQAAATSWKKIWKKELKPLAAKTFYTKKKSDARYYTKAESGAAFQPKGSYEPAGSGYTKAESDAKYAPMPGVIRGSYGLQVAPNTGALAVSVSFGVTLSAPPTTHYITPGSPVPAGCSGTLEAPGADPGHMCIFESGSSNVANQATLSGTATSTADPFGLFIYATQTNPAASSFFRGTWAVRPAAAVTAAGPTRSRPTPATRSGSGFLG